MQEIQGNRSFSPAWRQCDTAWPRPSFGEPFQMQGHVMCIHVAMAPYSDICMVLNHYRNLEGVLQNPPF